MTSAEEAAAALLGAVLTYGEPALAVVVDERVTPRHMPGRGGFVLQAILDVHAASKQVEPLTVKAHLEPAATAGTHPWSDALDMQATVDALVGPVPELGSLRSYCQIVLDHAWWARAGEQLHHAGEAYSRRNRSSLLAAIAALDSDGPAGVAKTQGAAFLDWYDSDAQGIPLPFKELTEAVGGGLQAGEATIIGAWPGMGKSIFAKDCLLTAVEQGARVHDYANEQFGPRRTARLISSLTGISSARIRRRQLDGDQWARVLRVLGDLEAHGRPYRTTATPGWTADDYARDLRRNKWDVAVIDTVTNLPCSKVEEWDRAVGVLCDAAAQAGTQLLMCCQLNLSRDDGATRKPPVIRDLRNTGAWSQRAKVVLFVHCDQELREKVPVTLPEGHIRVDKANDNDTDSLGFVQVCRNYTWARFDRLVGTDWREQAA